MKINGSGSIRPRKDKSGKVVKDRYQLTVSAGFDADGKRIQYFRSFRGTKTEAKRALEEFRREIEGGLRVDARNMTFKEYADDWCNTRSASGQLAPATIRRDKDALKHINKHLGKLKLEEITAPVVRNLLTKLTQEGLGQASLVRVYGVVNQIMKQALMDDLVLRNPCDAVRKPKQKKSEIGKALNRSEITSLMRALDKLENKEYPLEGDT